VRQKHGCLKQPPQSRLKWAAVRSAPVSSASNKPRAPCAGAQSLTIVDIALALPVLADDYVDPWVKFHELARAVALEARDFYVLDVHSALSARFELLTRSPQASEISAQARSDRSNTPMIIN